MKLKKSQMKMLASIIFVIVSFMLLALLINQYFSKATGKTAESICRGSVAARQTAIIDLGVTEVNAPLLCYTQDITITPKGRTEDEQKDSIMRQVADRMVRCWWMFGEGQVDDVFKKSSFEDNKCLPCYTFDINEGSKFKGSITVNDFTEFFITTPYKIESESDECLNFGGFCIEESKKIEIIDRSGSNLGWKYDSFNSVCNDKYKGTKDKGKASGCFYNQYSCLNKGGICRTNCETPKETSLPSDYWVCPEEDQKCCVDADKFFAYKDYVQFFGGKGFTQMIIPSLETGSRERYAIAFGSVNEGCGDACLTGAVGAGLLTAGILVIGVVATPFTGGGSLAVAIAASALVAKATTAGVITYYALQADATLRDKLIKYRELPTIYLTKLDDLENKCEPYED